MRASIDQFWIIRERAQTRISEKSPFSLKIIWRMLSKVRYRIFFEIFHTMLPLALWPPSEQRTHSGALWQWHHVTTSSPRSVSFSCRATISPNHTPSPNSVAVNKTTISRTDRRAASRPSRWRIDDHSVLLEARCLPTMGVVLSIQVRWRWRPKVVTAVPLLEVPWSYHGVVKWSLDPRGFLRRSISQRYCSSHPSKSRGGVDVPDSGGVREREKSSN